MLFSVEFRKCEYAYPIYAQNLSNSQTATSIWCTTLESTAAKDNSIAHAAAALIRNHDAATLLRSAEAELQSTI